MTNSIKAGFRVWVKLADNTTVLAGALAIEQLPNQKLKTIQFQYSPKYLKEPLAYSLDPINAPLQSQPFNYDTAGRCLPGFIDDCLPDDWGRSIVALRYNKDKPPELQKRHLDTVTLMQNMSGAGIGSVQITPKEADPTIPLWSLGTQRQQLERIAELIFNDDLQAALELDEDAAFIFQGSSKVGGARPKLLIEENGVGFLLKFNRSRDAFDMAVAEWLCMSTFKDAGLSAAEVEIIEFNNARALKVKRFDLSNNEQHHMITINALLKDPFTQDDPHFGRYEDIAQIIKKYSHQPREDLKLLLGQVVLNGMLNNTDDHLRNFSMLHTRKGWQLSPVYDVVPSETIGSYHQLTLGGKPFINDVSQTVEIGKLLNVSKVDSLDVKNRIEYALTKIRDNADSIDISDQERKLVKRFLPKIKW